MTARDSRPTRRALLIGAAVTVAGCTTARPPRVSPGPDDAALLAAWQAESRLLGGYADASPRRAAHLAHLRALETRLVVVPSGSATPSAAASSPVAADERASVAPLQAAARAARDGTNAALLASIAASHAVLAQDGR